uniref:NAC domain-containing protein 5 n=1 Tax=Noccaea caerulescens TaxID=107243 RepID=A0A1J3EY18_NOCCA
MENTVGLRFRPTDEEMVERYLRPKNHDSDTSHVDRVISTVNICSFDPWDLPSESRMKSKDQVWYFFGRKEKRYNRGDRQMRKTKSGFWKKTGKTMDILKRNRQKIGEKRVLVFHLGGSKTDWVMHEYHDTSLSPNQMMTYTICKVKFNGEERDISTSSSSFSAASEIEHINNSGGLSTGSEAAQSQTLTGSEGSSFERLHSQELENTPLFSGFLDVHQETLLEDSILWDFSDLYSNDWNSLLNDNEHEQINIVSTQEDRSNYRPPKPLSGVFTDDSDSDSSSSIQTSSTCGSFGNSNHCIDQITDLQESPNSTIKFVSLTQEVSQSLGQGTGFGEQKLSQKTIKNKRAGFFYRIIQRFIKQIQLCSSIASRT